MKKINNKNFVYFAVTVIIEMMIFLPFLRGHYAADSYTIYGVGYKTYSMEWYLKDGRLLMAIIGILADKFNLSIKIYSIITLIMAILISSITVIVLKNIIEKYRKTESIKQELIVWLISYVTIFNFMYMDCMYFVDAVSMSISILLFIISAYIMAHNKKKNKSLFISLLLTFLGIICYQGSICIYIAFSVLFILLRKDDNIKYKIIDIMKCALIALIISLMDIILVKSINNILNMQQIRIGRTSIFQNCLIIVLNFGKVIIETCKTFPPYLFIVYMVVSLFTLLIYCVKSDEKYKKDVFYKLLIIVLVAIFSSFCTNLLTVSSFYAGRMRLSIGCTFGIIMIYAYTNTNILQNKSIFNKIMICILISFLAVNIINDEVLMIRHKNINQQEKTQCEEIVSYIKEYEEKTGQNVTQIVKIIVKDEKYLRKIEKDLKTSYEMNAIRTDWACSGVIKFYTDLDLKKCYANKEQIKEYKKIRDNNNGYKCIGDSLYLEIYYY